VPDPGSTSTLGLVLGLFSAATWAAGSHLFARRLQEHRDVPPAAANLFKNASALIVFGALALVLGWELPAFEHTLLLVLSGALGFAVGDALYFAAFEHCGVQLAALSANLIPPISAVIAYFTLGETIAPLELAAMGVVITGIIVVLQGRSGGARAPRPGLGLAYAAAAALVQSTSMVVARSALNALDGTFDSLMAANVARLIGAVLGAFVIAAVTDLVLRRPTQLRGILAPWRRELAPGFFVAAFVAAIVNLPAFTYALANLKVGVSAVLFGTTPLFTLPIGMALGSRYGPKVWIGSAIAFGGIVLLVSAV
jgi:drug/metabolite transporter (DMT)-like permease